MSQAKGFHLHGDEIAAWHDAVYRQGWVAPNWPKEFGGTGWSPIQRFIFEVEYGLANAPELSLIALSMAGPVICRFGSQFLKDKFLEPMLRGDIWFCQGFSEPQAGSDLASVKTSAVRDGDDYTITGQKVWTTAAHMADYMICLARTNSQVKPQAGLSMILIPMNAKGVTVRPIHTIDADHHINEVFLDEVRVPAEYLIGEPDSGWTQAKYLLGHERTHNAYIGMLRRYMQRIPTMIRSELDNGLDPAVAAELHRRQVHLTIEVDALEWSVLRILASPEGPQLGAAASAVAVRGADLLLRAGALEMAIFGQQMAVQYLPSEPGPMTGSSPAAAGRVTQYLYWRSATIFGGSDEIQLSIIWATLFR
ncbi:MAG: acyl-CoA dehydrogenase family protein [Sphingomonas sp.]|nr:acyl-CoA dehydrogenase family protein [Sphingomonas sp.]